MQLKRGQIIAGGVVVALVGLVALRLRPSAVIVDAATVSRAPLESTVDAEGRTRVRNRYIVVAPVAGRVERIAFTEGAVVRPNDPVATITPLPMDSAARIQARARVDAADAVLVQSTAEIRLATAQLNQQTRELGRAERLAEAGGVAPRVLEEARLAHLEAEENLRVARERSRAADADARQARAALAGQEQASSMRTIVRAPAGGRVLRIPERSERIVAAGAPLLELGDPRSLEVVIEVLSSDAGMVHSGDQVRFAEWIGGETDVATQRIAGRVREIEPSGFTKVSALGVEEQRVNVIVDIDPAPIAIGDGFRVEASIVVWSVTETTVVPRSALLPSAGVAGWSAFIVRDGRIESRAVRIGHTGREAAEVLGGVEPGDQVVVFPSDRLSVGTRVKARSRPRS
jgi:HlyD family secretion protein